MRPHTCSLAAICSTICNVHTLPTSYIIKTYTFTFTHKHPTLSARRLGHLGKELVPPFAPDPSQPVEPLEPTDVSVSGTTWTASSTDVAIAGLGWIAVGVNGDAAVRVWAPPGIAITVRQAMLPDYAKEFERPGFRLANPRARKAAEEARGGEKIKGGEGKKGGKASEEGPTGKGRRRRAVPVV